MLVAAELGWIVPEFAIVAPREARPVYVALAAAVVVGAVAAAASVLRRRRDARYFLITSAIAFVPPCATYPSSRLLLLPSFGALAFIAICVEEAFGGGAARGAPIVTVEPEFVRAVEGGRELRIPLAAGYGGEIFLAHDMPASGGAQPR